MNLGKLKLNSFTLVITILIIAALILLNIFAGMLTERFFLRADITATGLYTLSDEAAEFLQTVNETVDIIVLEEESKWLANDAYTQVLRVLENYTAHSGGRIRVQYVNPDLNTFDGTAYDNTLSTLRDAHTELEGMERNDIVFLSSRRAAKVSAADLFAFDYDGTGRVVPVGTTADQRLVSSLSYVLNESVARAVFTSNHQENTNEFMKLVFERSGFMCQDINLATEDIPEDALIVISTGPKSDFLGNETEKLEQYLTEGGNVMVLYDFAVVSLPVLDSFLEQWGIIVESKVIIDEDYTYIPQLGVIGAHVIAGNMPFTVQAENITKSEAPLGIYLPRPLSPAWVGDTSGGFTLYPMMQTFSASSYAKELGSAATYERETGDASGPFILAYHVRKLSINTEGNYVTGNLIAGGANMFEDQFLSTYGNSFYNLVFIAGIAGDINPFGEGVYIPSKALSDSVMPVSSGGARSVLIFMVIGLPLAIVAAGVVVWRKRRNL